jgi:Mg2+ and Co2+ transporter CorA
VGDHALLLLDVANGALSMHSNLVNERLNQVMKYLAVISTVALPFTVISGLFGMNFDAIPAAHEALGFWHALALMSLLGLAFVGWFRYRRWL